jgi:hypothetical protein|tara:strand:+ start:459 stop:563 length:105 start_codon:yes stop_codon:yes gene_type:complete
VVAEEGLEEEADSEEPEMRKSMNIFDHGVQSIDL